MNCRIPVLKSVLMALLLLLLHPGRLSAQPCIEVEPESYSLELPLGSCRSDMVNVSNQGDSLLVVEIDQGEPRRDSDLQITMWTRFADMEREYMNIITCMQSIPVEFHITLYDGADPDEFGELVERSHMLLIPEPENGSPQALFDTGMQFEEALGKFMGERGGYVLALDYAGNTTRFLAGAGLIDIEVQELYPSVECTAVGTHPITSGVRQYIALHSNLHRTNDPEALVVAEGSEEMGSNITVKRFGEGGVAYLGMDWWTFNEEMTQLLVNAVMWSRGKSDWMTVEPCLLRIRPLDFADMVFSIETRLLPDIGEYARDIILRSNDPLRPEVRVPVSLMVTPWLPAGVTVEPTRVFMISGEDRDTSTVVIVRNPGPGRLFARLELEDPTQQWLAFNRDTISLDSGFIDRVLLDFSPEAADPWVVYNGLRFTFDNPEPESVLLPVLYYTQDIFGSIEGWISDAVDRTAVQDAVIDIGGLTTTTDNNGYFLMDAVPPCRYALTVSHPDYLDDTTNVEVNPDRTTQTYVRLYYSLLETDLDRYARVILTPDTAYRLEGTFTNRGSGPLSYQVRFNETTPVHQLRPWQVRLNIAGGEIAGAERLFGAVFDGENLLVSGTIAPGEPERIFVISREGELVGSFPQPEEHPLGMADLAWDGELIYGSGIQEIIGIDRQGQIVERFRGPFNYNRAIAWDPHDDLFWVADARSYVAAVNRRGRVVAVRENPDELHIYGMAWRWDEPEGYNLYLFCQDGPNNAQINVMNPETGDIRYVRDLPSEGNEHAGGAEVTPQWDPRHWTLITQFTGGSNRTTAYNIDLSRNWARIEPAATVIPAGGVQPATLEFNTYGLNIGEQLEGFFTIDGHQRGGPDTIAVLMAIGESGAPEDDGEGCLPDAMELTTYPNPFNSRIAVRFRSPAGVIATLNVYDVEGRLVAELFKGRGSGVATATSMRGKELTSGVYLLVLNAGQRRMVRKLILVK